MSMTELSKSVLSCRQLQKFDYRRFLAFTTSLDIEVVKEDRLGPRSRIGSGAYATVYSSTLFGQPDRPVAIKCIEETLSFDDERIEAETVNVVLATITQELRIMAHPTLRQHPNIPRILGVSFDDEGDAVRPILVMELAQGTLSTIVDASTSWNERIRLARDAADGLVALHAHNIVHGDIKCSNILVFDREGTRVAVISDLDHAGVKNDLQLIVGTTTFYAPECFPESQYYEFDKNGCGRDIYSFGLVLLALAAGGTAPDEQVQLQRTAEDVQSEYIKTLIPNDAPPGFFNLTHSCLAHQPSARPSAQTVSIKLSELLREERPALGLAIDEEHIQLLENADTPRLRFFRVNPVSPHLAAKLFVEHLQTSTSSPTIRGCIGLAAFYMGVYGEDFKPQADKTTQATAAMQWLVKAIELGSYATLLVVHAEPFWKMLTESKGALLFSRHQSFESPSIDMDYLRKRLHTFSDALYAKDMCQLLEKCSVPAQDSTSHLVADQSTNYVDDSDHLDIVRLLGTAMKPLHTPNADTAQIVDAAEATVSIVHRVFVHDEPCLESVTQPKGLFSQRPYQSIGSPTIDMDRLRETLGSFKDEITAKDLFQLLQCCRVPDHELASCGPVAGQRFLQSEEGAFDVVGLLAGVSKLLITAKPDDTTPIAVVAKVTLIAVQKLMMRHKAFREVYKECKNSFKRRVHAPNSTSNDPAVDRFPHHDNSDHFDVVDLLSSGHKLLLAANADDTAQFIAATNENPLLPKDTLYTAMGIAISSGSLGIVRYLIEEKGIAIDSYHNNESWVNQAIWWGQPNLVAYFIKEGAVLDHSKASTFPLHSAGSRNNPELAQLLCTHFQERGCLDEAFRALCNDLTPLSNAILLRAYKVAQEFISFGAIPDGNIEGFPVLHVALWPKHGYMPMSLLRLLISKCPLDILNTHLCGLMNPIEIAVLSGNLPATYCLLMAGADVNNSAPLIAWRKLEDAEKRRSQIDKGIFVDEEGREIADDDESEEIYYRIRQFINFVIWRRLKLLAREHGTSWAAVQHRALLENLTPQEDEELEEHLNEELETLPKYLVDKVWGFGVPTLQYAIPS